MQAATFVTARLGSSRLPGKVLTDIGGRPALDRLIERVRTAQHSDLVVLCTTGEPEDDPLEAAAARLAIECFRGSTEDVLARWLGAAQTFGVDFLVNCDADDLFCDPVFVDRVITCHEETDADYVACVGLPFGAAPTGISVAGLVRVCERKSDTNTEGQGRFFSDPSLVSRAEVVAPEELRMDEARMTLDYPEDVTFFEAVISELEQEDAIFSLREIVTLLRARPDIVAINSGRQAEYWERFHQKYPPVELAP